MGDRLLKLKTLRKRLRAFGVQEDPSRGKGSHTMFVKIFDDGTSTYPIPTTRKDILACYVTGCRRVFRLTEEDGVSDADFYGE